MHNGYGQAGGSGDLASDKLMTAREMERLGAANTPKQIPAMDVAVRNLGMNIERLLQAVTNLQAKLEPVLYPEPPQPASTGGGIEARAPRASSGLGCSINNFADQIELLTERVNSTTRRCEL